MEETPTNPLFRIRPYVDKFLSYVLIGLMLVMVLDVTWQVVTRFVLHHPSSWTEELATFLMIWVGLLGASVALNRGAHLGIDYFILKLSPEKRRYTELFVFFCVAVFSLLVLVIGGINLVRITLQNNQISPALGLKMGHVYLALPISGFFLVLYSVEFFIERVVALVKGRQIQQRRDFESTAAMD